MNFKNRFLSLVFIFTFAFSVVNAQTPSPTPPPVISTSVTSSSVTTNSATLNGSIISGPVVSRGFQYGTTPSYGVTLSENSSSIGAFSRSITGLTPGTTYYFRSFVANYAGSRYSTGSTFTTAASPSPSPSPTPTPPPPAPSVSPSPSPSPTPSPTPTPPPAPSASPSPSPSVIPVVSIGLPPVISSYVITLNGIVNSQGSSVVYNRGFKIGINPGIYLWVDNEVSATGFPSNNFTINSINDCETRYYYRAYATSAAGQGESSESSFVTGACPVYSTPTPSPSPTPPPAPSASPSPSSSPTPTPTPSPAPSSSPSPTPTPPPTPGPTPTPQPVISSVVTSANVTRNSATLNGSISTGPVTSRGFQYGTTPSYGLTVSESSSSVGPYSMPLTGLTSGVTYYYRAFASNSSGTVFSPSSTFTTNASPSSLVGWAWSSNIGWIRFDDLVSPVVSPVMIDQVTGNMNGYGWSPNIGWIKFGGLTISDMPVGGATRQNANINFNTGVISGWILACAGTVNGDCSSLASRNDGWDGWIELAGANHPSVPSSPSATPTPAPITLINVANAQSGSTNYNGLSMNLTTGQITGMAWGGPVIGWLNFNAGVSIASSTTFTSSCTATDLGANKVRFTAGASGGSGNYEYEWNNSGTWVTTPYFTGTYFTGGSNVVVPLKAREFGQISFATPLCTFTPPPTTGITFIPSAEPVCSVSPVKATTGRPVTFSVNANAQPPSDTFTYAWYPGNGDNQPPSALKTRQYTYATSSKSEGYPTGYDVQVNVRNTTRGSFITKSCGKVVVEDPSLNLYIGADATGAKVNTLTKDGNKYYVTRLGRSFALVLDNTLEMQSPSIPDGYTCSKATTYSPGSASWSNLNENLSTDTVNLTANVIGEYKFTISCESLKAGNTDKIQTAILKVISSSEKEI